MSKFFSALLYLNGDFTGGEFLFANPDESVQVYKSLTAVFWVIFVLSRKYK